jgi:hypothetical protein
VPVTADRVQALLENIDTGGGQNGVGLTQLTSVNLVLEAEQRGGAHLPKHQCSVGFEYLKSLVDDLGYVHGIAVYNSGPSNAQLGITNGYYGKVQARREKWKGLLAGVLGGVVTEPATKPVVEPATQPGISVKRSGILKAKEGTNFRKGLDYILPIIGQRDYWVWSGGPVPDGEGMYADNKPLPPVEQIGNINCAGTTNLFFRAMRKRIPNLGNPLYDGGVAAYAGAPSATATSLATPNRSTSGRRRAGRRRPSAASCCCAPTGTRASRGRGTSPSCCPPATSCSRSPT